MPGALVTSAGQISVLQLNGLPIALNSSNNPVLQDPNGMPASSGVIAPPITPPANNELIDPMPVAGDFAQVEYVGWGFRIFFRVSPSLGVCDLYLDGVRVVQSFDLSIGTAAATSADISPSEDGSSTVVTMQNVPLDKDRVKLVALAQAGSRGGTAVIFPRIEVMH